VTGRALKHGQDADPVYRCASAPGINCIEGQAVGRSGVQPIPMLALSDYLNQLSIHPERKWNENFRNTSAVYTKLSGFASLEPDTNEKWLPASVLMKEIWSEFSQDGNALEEAVQSIRGKYA